jgi:hypothetical protein
MVAANSLNISETGFQSFDGVSVFKGRTLQAGTGISISNGTGVTGNPTVSSSLNFPLDPSLGGTGANNAATSGTLLRGNGTDFVPTTATYPDTAGTLGSFLISDGANFMSTLSPTITIGGSNVSAFGDIITVGLTPVIQLDFVYGINTQTGTTSVNTTGVADTNASRLRMQTGVGAAGAATFQSQRIARYRSGEGMVARFTAVWTNNAENSEQIVGVGNTQVGYFFGYNGTEFGLIIRNGGTDNWIAQTAWNGDKCDGTGASAFNWNKTFGNVMMIQYPYLGYGAIKFWVQNPITGAWILCHTIQYPNTSASVQLSNPSFPFYANVVNTGSTTNLIMYVGSVGLFISGEREFLGAQWATDSLKNTITTEINLLNLRNCTTYNGVTNSGLIRLRSISTVTDNGNGIATIRLKTGVAIGGSPSFTTINGTTADQGATITSGNSISSVDVAGTGTTGSTIFNICLARNSNVVYDLTPFNIFIAPSQTLTVTAASAASASIQVALNWNEDV